MSQRGSRHRISPKAGWVNPKSLPHGPNGRALCRQCGTEVPPGRRTFCSSDCVSRWKVKTDPQHVRHLLLKRDQGFCALCRADCIAVENARDNFFREILKARYGYDCGMMPHGPRLRLSPEEDAKVLAFAQRYPMLLRHARRPDEPLAHRIVRGSLWAADHIVPVAEGGGECDLDNFRILCLDCHRRVTAELRARLAARRRQDPDGAPGKG